MVCVWHSMRTCSLLVCSISLSSVAFAESKLVRLLQEGQDAVPMILEVRELPHDAAKDHAVLMHKYPQFIVEHGESRGGEIQEWLLPAAIDADAWLKARGAKDIPEADGEKFADEVITLVNNGPSANRIDLVFMGDGYTAAERDKFFADMQRLTNDMFVGHTFASYLPLFNVHAVFRPSQESGIGKNSTPKNTAYKLYREGNTLRAIFPGNTSALRDSCDQAPDCDYPIVIANDPNYGGLGGEFAISTSSESSGTVVLRHELGHNFGRVGEEYDGGGYFGANNTSSATSPSWAHWLNDKPKAQDAVSRFIDWPWKNLNGGPFVAEWRSSGKHSHYEITYSASGVDNDEALVIKLDGERLPFTSPGTLDRSFQTIMGHEGGFSAGTHRLEFSKGQTTGEPWFSNIAVFEYGPDYVFDRHHVSAYPVFSKSNTVAGYRPTDKTCLMRDMTSLEFCSVCQENNWLQFFARISVIDQVAVQNNLGKTSVNVVIPPLAQLREEPVSSTEGLKVRWTHNGKERAELAGRLTWEMDGQEAQGTWVVDVEFVTSEVRKDPRNLLKGSKTIKI